MTPSEAYYKAHNSCKRLPKLENIIMTSPWFSYLYAERVIQDRWIEAEDVIMNSAYCSLRYAHAIQSRLPDKMHNMMILHAIKNPNVCYIKEYFEYISK